MKAAEFAQRLTEVERRGRQWRANCPICHQWTLGFRDRKNALGVYCFHARSYVRAGEAMEVGCSLEAILAAVGLTELDILSEHGRSDLLQQFGGDRNQALRYLQEARAVADAGKAISGPRPLRGPWSQRWIRVRHVPPDRGER